MQFLTSAPNFRGQLTPDLGFPSPCLLFYKKSNAAWYTDIQMENCYAKFSFSNEVHTAFKCINESSLTYGQIKNHKSI